MNLALKVPHSLLRILPVNKWTKSYHISYPLTKITTHPERSLLYKAMDVAVQLTSKSEILTVPHH